MHILKIISLRKALNQFSVWMSLALCMYVGFFLPLVQADQAKKTSTSRYTYNLNTNKEDAYHKIFADLIKDIQQRKKPKTVEQVLDDMNGCIPKAHCKSVATLVSDLGGSIENILLEHEGTETYPKIIDRLNKLGSFFSYLDAQKTFLDDYFKLEFGYALVKSRDKNGVISEKPNWIVMRKAYDQEPRVQMYQAYAKKIITSLIDKDVAEYDIGHNVLDLFVDGNYSFEGIIEKEIFEDYFGQERNLNYTLPIDQPKTNNLVHNQKQEPSLIKKALRDKATIDVFSNLMMGDAIKRTLRAIAKMERYHYEEAPLIKTQTSLQTYLKLFCSTEKQGTAPEQTGAYTEASNQSAVLSRTIKQTNCQLMVEEAWHDIDSVPATDLVKAVNRVNVEIKELNRFVDRLNYPDGNSRQKIRDFYQPYLNQYGTVLGSDPLAAILVTQAFIPFRHRRMGVESLGRNPSADRLLGFGYQWGQKLYNQSVGSSLTHVFWNDPSDIEVYANSFKEVFPPEFFDYKTKHRFDTGRLDNVPVQHALLSYDQEGRAKIKLGLEMAIAEAKSDLATLLKRRDDPGATSINILQGLLWNSTAAGLHILEQNPEFILVAQSALAKEFVDQRRQEKQDQVNGKVMMVIGLTAMAVMIGTGAYLGVVAMMNQSIASWVSVLTIMPGLTATSAGTIATPIAGALHMASTSVGISCLLTGGVWTYGIFKKEDRRYKAYLGAYLSQNMDEFNYKTHAEHIDQRFMTIAAQVFATISDLIL